MDTRSYLSEIAREDAALQRYMRAVVRNADDGEDAVQEAWLAAVRRDVPRSWHNPQGWLRVVARRIARREHARRSLRLAGERTAAMEARDRKKSWDEPGERETALHALKRLPEPYRSVLRLRFFDDLSVEEIASTFGRPVATVRSQVQRGLELLRARLSPRQRVERDWLLAPLGARLGPALRRRFENIGARLLSVRVVITLFLLVGSFALGLRLAPRSRDGVSEAALSKAAPLAEAAPLAAALDGTHEPVAPLVRSELASLPLEERDDPARDPHGAAATSAESTLMVEVVDELGEAVPDAAVSIANACGTTLRGATDERGRCRVAVDTYDAGIPGIPATRGRVALHASARGLARSPFVHVPLELCDGRSVRLTLAGTELVLSGRVVDERGRPIAGAQVSCGGSQAFQAAPVSGVFESPWFAETRSDESGGFRLENLPAAAQLVFVEAPGHAPHRERVELPSRSPGSHAPGSQAIERTFVLSPGAAVYGRVLGAAGGPAAHASVFTEPTERTTEWAARREGFDARLGGRVSRTSTDERGDFRLTGIPAGTLRIWALDCDGDGDQVATAVLDLAAGEETTWDAELSSTAPLELCVVDERGEPLAELPLRLRAGEAPDEWLRVLATDARGCARIVDCVPSEISADVLDPRMVELRASATGLLAGATVQRIVVPDRAGARGILRGVLLDHEGRPFEQVELKRYDPRTGTAMALPVDVASGRFEQEFPAGSFLLACVAGLRALSLGEHELASGAVLDLGVVRAPAPGRLFLARGMTPGLGSEPAAFRLAVHYPISQPRPLFRELLRGAWPPPESLELFPGRHCLEVLDESGDVIFRAAADVVPHGDAWMDLP